ncbi:hypothetical protein CEP88_20165 (plasmid) [Roseobacter denitrificans]|nr:hypothetical protein CEP88_20165 [Roseobacter denitrificans]SFG43778.1 hypothetical protein SAMN05443635_1185 [Roseobacter denitrificans OCh 114]
MKIGGASGINDPGGTYDKKMIEQTVDWVVKTVPIHCAISSAFSVHYIIRRSSAFSMEAHLSKLFRKHIVNVSSIYPHQRAI